MQHVFISLKNHGQNRRVFAFFFVIMTNILTIRPIKVRLVSALMLSLFLIFSRTHGQTDEQKPSVMVLGTFHFAYPNLDLIKVDKKDQIDILNPVRQDEIQNILQSLAEFNPTIIAIENKTWEQQSIDEQYSLYLKDSFDLPRQEQYQIAFRLAKKLNHKQLYSIDTWGNMEYFASQIGGPNSFKERPDRKEQLRAIEVAQQKKLEIITSKDTGKTSAYSTLGEILYNINLPQSLKLDHQGYFQHVFESEANLYDYTGVDWVTLSWYNRNLRIFRNLLRLNAKPQDRILVLYGSGHAYLLNQFLEESGRFQKISPLPYLEKKR